MEEKMLKNWKKNKKKKEPDDQKLPQGPKVEDS